jgi:hypothetical protein
MIPDRRTEVQLTTGEWMLGFGGNNFRSESPDFYNKESGSAVALNQQSNAGLPNFLCGAYQNGKNIPHNLKIHIPKWS